MISSGRKEYYSYRVYRPEEFRRLRQILVLRKLRLSQKEIGSILNDPRSAAALSVFEKNLSRLNREIQALQAIRSVIEAFPEALKQRQTLPAGEVILQDSQLLAPGNAIPEYSICKGLWMMI